jgi:hypothetical protein
MANKTAGPRPVRQQRPIGNVADGPEDGGAPPTGSTEPQFRGRHKLHPNAEKEGVRPEVDSPEGGVNHISNGR